MKFQTKKVVVSDSQSSLLTDVVVLTPSDEIVAWRKNYNVCEQATARGAKLSSWLPQETWLPAVAMLVTAFTLKIILYINCVFIHMHVQMLNHLQCEWF